MAVRLSAHLASSPLNLSLVVTAESTQHFADPSWDLALETLSQHHLHLFFGRNHPPATGHYDAFPPEVIFECSEVSKCVECDFFVVIDFNLVFEEFTLLHGKQLLTMDRRTLTS